MTDASKGDFSGRRRIELPPLVAQGDLLVVASVSGGKDSTALALALLEAGVPFRPVFADLAATRVALETTRGHQVATIDDGTARSS